MKKQLALPYPGPLSVKPTQLSGECWFDDACILDVDYFVKTLAGIKAKGVRPDLIGSIITHYASKWLPELSAAEPLENSSTNYELTTPEGAATATSSWMKKRFFLETLVGILPPEKDSIPCNFLLRLLKNANMVGVDSLHQDELEKRISQQLDQASLRELLIPSFSHTRATFLDVELVLRLVKGFVNMDEGARSGAAMVKVAKLVDSYLAEAAADQNLRLPEFIALAGSLPAQARATDDGLYRAIDIYLKSHPEASKMERKALCKLMDCQKLSVEASVHAAQNERLPVRAVIQVLFSEQTKLNCQIDWSRSFSTARSPKLGLDYQDSSRSKPAMALQQTEIQRLKDDVLRLQSLCFFMQGQIDKLSQKKKGFFSWKKLGSGVIPLKTMSTTVADTIEVREIKGESSIGRQTPVDRKNKMVRANTQSRWRKSMS